MESDLHNDSSVAPFMNINSAIIQKKYIVGGWDQVYALCICCPKKVNQFLYFKRMRFQTYISYVKFG